MAEVGISTVGRSCESCYHCFWVDGWWRCMLMDSEIGEPVDPDNVACLSWSPLTVDG